MTEPFSDVSSAAKALHAERASTLEQLAALTRDWEGVVESSSLSGVDDEHDPEGATIAFERSHVEALMSRSRSHLADLDRAVERLREGTYGTCECCGGPIAPERLTARPTARTCITCAAR